MINNVILIASNELRRFFKSPLAWIILALVQFLVAIFKILKKLIFLFILYLKIKKKIIIKLFIINYFFLIIYLFCCILNLNRICLCFKNKKRSSMKKICILKII